MAFCYVSEHMSGFFFLCLCNKSDSKVIIENEI